MTEVWSRMRRAITSARLAAWLIGAQIGFLLLAYVVPQRGIFPDDQVESFLSDSPGVLAWLVRFLHLDHVFTSALFYMLAALLALNLLACTWQRVARRIHRALPTGGGTIPDGATVLYAADPAAVELVLSSLGAHAMEAGTNERRYYLRHGGVGFVGSVVMHVALVLILVAGVLTGLSTFRGEMVLTEGQTRSDTPDSYLAVTQVPVLGSAFSDFQVTLESMNFTYEHGTVTDAVANMRVTDSAGTHLRSSRVNYPLKAHGKSFLLQGAGHSVWIEVRDPGGTLVLDSFVNLANVTAFGYTDSFAIGDKKLHVLSRPDGSRPVDEAIVNGLQLSSPIVGLSLGEPKAPRDFVWVTPGSESVNLDGYTASVKEMRVWNRFLVRADGGRSLMYVAFLLVILGAIVRFADPDRWLRVTVVEDPSATKVYLWGAERYRIGVLPREGRRIVREVLDDGEGHVRDTDAAVGGGHTPTMEVQE